MPQQLRQYSRLGRGYENHMIHAGVMASIEGGRSTWNQQKHPNPLGSS
jgi:hypothetical protein